MKEKLTLVYPRCEDAIRTKRLRALLEEVLGDYEVETIQTVDAFGPLNFCNPTGYFRGQFGVLPFFEKNENGYFDARGKRWRHYY